MHKVLVIGSASIHVKNHLARIRRCCASLWVVTPQAGFSSDADHHHVVDLQLRDPFRFLASVWRLRKLYRSLSPDVIHIHQANAVAFIALLAKGSMPIPVVLTLWGSDVLVLPKKNALMKAMVRYNLRRANALTADARFLANAAQELMGHQHLNLHVCNFGVHPIDIQCPKEPLIYSNRAHEPLYRIDAVVEAFARFKSTERGEHWRLVIAGRGSTTEALKKRVEELKLNDSVSFVGFVDAETNQHFCARASVFCSLPESDATSISLLEALYHGCIPVVSDLPANHEWVTHEETGIIVSDPKGDPFSSALELDMETASSRNRALAREKATAQVASAAFCRILDEVTQPLK